MATFLFDRLRVITQPQVVDSCNRPTSTDCPTLLGFPGVQATGRVLEDLQTLTEGALVFGDFGMFMPYLSKSRALPGGALVRLDGLQVMVDLGGPTVTVYVNPDQASSNRAFERECEKWLNCLCPRGS